MREEHQVDRFERGDVLARLAASDPASSVAPLSEGALSRVTRHAMTPSVHPWSRRRFRLASLGALVGSGGLVLAGVLGIEAASPALPLLALGRIPQSSVSRDYGAISQPTPTVPFADFSFTSARLASGAHSARTYRLDSPIGAAKAASELAATFRVRGHLARLSSGAYRIVAKHGAVITTWTSAGVVEWSLRGPAQVLGGAEDLNSSAEKVTHESLSILNRLDTGFDAGIATSARSAYGIEVLVPVVAGHSATDQVNELAFGVSGAVESARGEFAAERPGPVYPTISARQAIGVLRANHGFVIYGGIAPLETNAVPGGVKPFEPNAVYNTSGGFSNEAGPPTSVVVHIDHAALRYATYVLADGPTWLLPTWWLSGTEHGEGVAPGTRYSAYVLAVAPRYVRLETGSTTP